MCFCNAIYSFHIHQLFAGIAALAVVEKPTRGSAQDPATRSQDEQTRA